MSPEAQIPHIVDPWNSHGKTVNQNLGQSLIGIISMVRYLSVNYALMLSLALVDFDGN
jgi:hypothetical protein